METTKYTKYTKGSLRYMVFRSYPALSGGYRRFLKVSDFFGDHGIRRAAQAKPLNELNKLNTLNEEALEFARATEAFTKMNMTMNQIADAGQNDRDPRSASSFPLLPSVKSLPDQTGPTGVAQAARGQRVRRGTSIGNPELSGVIRR